MAFQTQFTFPKSAVSLFSSLTSYWYQKQAREEEDPPFSVPYRERNARIAHRTGTKPHRADPDDGT